MPVRLSHWQSQISNACSKMTGQWSDRSEMSSCKTLSPPDPVSYSRGLALKIWTLFWRRKCCAGMDMWNAPILLSRQPLTYKLMESVGLGGPRWHVTWAQLTARDCREWKLSAIDPHDRYTWRSGVIDIPGDLVWDLPCMQQASYLEGGPIDVMWVPAR